MANEERQSAKNNPERTFKDGEIVEVKTTQNDGSVTVTKAVVKFKGTVSYADVLDEEHYTLDPIGDKDNKTS